MGGIFCQSNETHTPGRIVRSPHPLTFSCCHKVQKWQSPHLRSYGAHNQRLLWRREVGAHILTCINTTNLIVWSGLRDQTTLGFDLIPGLWFTSTSWWLPSEAGGGFNLYTSSIQAQEKPPFFFTFLPSDSLYPTTTIGQQNAHQKAVAAPDILS